MRRIAAAAGGLGGYVTARPPAAPARSDDLTLYGLLYEEDVSVLVEKDELRKAGDGISEDLMRARTEERHPAGSDSAGSAAACSPQRACGAAPPEGAGNPRIPEIAPSIIDGWWFCAPQEPHAPLAAPQHGHGPPCILLASFSRAELRPLAGKVDLFSEGYAR